MIEVVLGGAAIGFVAWLASSGKSKSPATRFSYMSTQGHHFEFSLVPHTSGEVRVYILAAPSYGCRASDGHSTHRYYDDEHGHYVCIRGDLAPTNIPDAQSWARYWAEQTSIYINTGREFS
jgi:hypothetical protein